MPATLDPALDPIAIVVSEGDRGITVSSALSVVERDRIGLLREAERIAAIGHGRRNQITAQQSLDVARDATSIARATVDPQDPNGRKPGQSVTVTPDDTGRDPVVGEIVIRRSDREIGEVCVHFPRAGLVVAPA